MIELIEKYICLKRGIKSNDLHERNGNNKLKRNKEIVLARQIIVYYACLNGYSGSNAGMFYGLDHATVYHAQNKIIDFCQIYHDFRDEIANYDKVLLGLNSCEPKEIIKRMDDNKEQKVKFINSLLSDVESDINKYIEKLNSLKSIIFDLQKETSRTDVEQI